MMLRKHRRAYLNRETQITLITFVSAVFFEAFVSLEKRWVTKQTQNKFQPTNERNSVKTIRK